MELTGGTYWINRNIFLAVSCSMLNYPFLPNKLTPKHSDLSFLVVLSVGWICWAPLGSLVLLCSVAELAEGWASSQTWKSYHPRQWRQQSQGLLRLMIGNIKMSLPPPFFHHKSSSILRDWRMEKQTPSLCGRSSRATLQRNVHNVHRSSVYNSQDMDAT